MRKKSNRKTGSAPDDADGKERLLGNLGRLDFTPVDEMVADRPVSGLYTVGEGDVAVCNPSGIVRVTYTP